jgi:predicted GTPase
VRDLGTTYTLINDVIFPNFPHEDRIIVGLNKCDKAISRTPKFNKDPFNFEENKPEPHLHELPGRKADTSSEISDL